ncbi:hypothetical protein Amsp01_088960 [Amycolatopsis sp. NBRC 101858]|uniref:hypothetical protein n=1 Tax=Amycolatopsis sp. NBRC 101858 TaxID=3032200 RepID=UPI0024A11AA0|nr:hypothetical protein [Amycolatopsis sp. NBRC 101858]GLY42873.1 hypothetical protein Amsp01_088960 [Amycolatopsis sp. NBRC 101858]
MNQRWTETLAAAAALLLLALLGACGATSDTPTSSNSPASTGKPAFHSFDEFQLAFASCMREQGVNMRDPSGGVQELDGGGDKAAFTEAAKKCRAKLGTPPPAPQGTGAAKSDEQLLADQLKIAQCLREHGVNVQDPTASSPVVIPPNTPDDVQKTCAPNGIVGRASGGN